MRKLYNLFILTGVALLLSLTLAGCSNNSKTPAQKTFEVKLNDRQQLIRFIGSDMERSADHMQMAKSPMQIAELTFGDVNFSICRVSFDKEQEMVEGVKNMAFYDKPIQSMKDIRKVNPHIEFWGTLKSDYDGYGDDSNLPDWICSYPIDATPHFFHVDKYARFLADYLELMENEGVGLAYIAVSKEWSSYITADLTIDIVKSLTAECEARGIKTPKFTDPAAWSITQGIDFVNAIKERDELSLFYCLTTHSYDRNETKTFKDFVDTVNSCNSDCFPFQDETSSGAGSRMNEENPNLELPNLSQLINSYWKKAEMYRDGMAGELIFEPFSRGVDPERRSIHFRVGEEPAFMRAYFCMKEFVNSIAPKNDRENLEYEGGVNPESKYYVTTDNCQSLNDVEVMSFANDKEVAICLINKADTVLKDVVFAIDGASELKGAKGRLFHQDIAIEGAELPNIDTQENYVLLGDVLAESIVFFTVKLQNN